MFQAPAALSSKANGSLVDQIHAVQDALADLHDSLAEEAKKILPKSTRQFVQKGYIACAVSHVDSTHQLLEWAADNLRNAVE